jgi:hypothetical protein
MAKKNKSGKGNGSGNGGSVMHPWEFHQGPTSPEGPPPDEPRVMEEFHIDCQGRRRHFRLQEHHRSFMSSIDATEVIEGEPIGMRLVEHFNDELQMPPYYEIRRRIAERLATRDLVRDPETGRLTDLHMRIRTQVHRGGESRGEGPDLLIDGDVVTWADLGNLLNTYEGWGLRIEITEAGEE